MKVLLIGGVGRMAIEATRDIVKTSGYSKFVIADREVKKAEAFAKELDDPRVSVEALDASDTKAIEQMMAEADLYLNGLPMKEIGSQDAPDLDRNVLEAAIRAGKSGVNLEGMPDEEIDERARNKGLTMVCQGGATPGITNVLALYQSMDLYEVDEINIAFAAWRSLAASPGLVDTTIWELHPKTPERCYYEEGRHIQAEPFSGARVVDFPDPIGPREVYFMAHSEPLTIPMHINARKVTLRGTWPPPVMNLFRWLNYYGFLTDKPIKVGDAVVSPEKFVREFLAYTPPAKEHDIWHYGLNVEVTGTKKGKKIRRVGIVSHPPEGQWGEGSAYAKFVGTPLSVIAQMLVNEQLLKTGGVMVPEACVTPEPFIEELKKRGFTFKFQEE